MTKKLSYLIETFIFVVLLCISVILAVDKRYAIAVTKGITLWASCVLPALFPYLFINTLLSSLKVTGKISSFLSPVTTKLFNVSGHVGYAFFISVISGYPIGAKTVSDLREKGLLGDAESIRASALCPTSSPTFLLGSVGNLMFKDSRFGCFLFLSHLISAILIGIIFSFYKRQEKPLSAKTLPLPNKINNVLYESTYTSVISVLVVGGLITIFYLLTELLLNLQLLNPLFYLFTLIFKNPELAKSIVLGCFECTKGLSTLALAKRSILSLPIASFICSFGGLSIIAQSLSYLKKAKIKTAPFILSKIISAVISFLVSLILSVIFI
jgi:sporulation integral membrane protein YlbJ